MANSIERENQRAGEINRMERALQEAGGRLHEPEESRESGEFVRWTTFTSEHTADEIKNYLEIEKSNLTPEAVFFLEATLHLRSAKGEDPVALLRAKKGAGPLGK